MKKNKSACEIPDKFEETQGGFKEARVSVCPRPSKVYSDLIESLNGIKNRIVSESCEKIEQKNNFDNKLDKLLTLSGKRSRFVNLMKKGLPGSGEKILPEEVTEVTAIVEETMGVASNIVDFVNENENCFVENGWFSRRNDGSKQSVLSFVSGVISEVSGAVGAVAGPFGAKINLAGQVGATLLGSVGKIVEAQKKKGYVFEDSEKGYNNIKNYFNTLCTYYDFKEDIDELTGVFVDPKTSLQLAHNLVDTYIQNVPENCRGTEYCEEVIAELSKSDQSSARIFRERRVYAEVYGEELKAEKSEEESEEDESEVPTSQSRDDDTEVINGVEFDSTELLKAYKDGSSDQQVLSKLFEAVPGLREELNPSLSDPIVLVDPVITSDPRSGLGLESGESEGDSGLEDPVLEAPVIVESAPDLHYSEIMPFIFEEVSTHWVSTLHPIEATVRAMRLRSWIRAEQDRREKKLIEIGDDGYDRLKGFQEQIENVLIKKEAKKYIRYITKKLNSDIKELKRYSERTVFRVLGSYRELGLYQGWAEGWEPSLSPEGNLFNQLYRNDVNFTRVISEAFLTRKQRKRAELNLKAWQREARSLLGNVVNGHELVLKRCLFFKNSKFVEYEGMIFDECEKASKALSQSQNIIENISQTSFIAFNSAPLERVFRDRNNYVPTFVSSIIYVIKRDLKEIGFSDDDIDEMSSY